MSGKVNQTENRFFFSYERKGVDLSLVTVMLQIDFPN